MKAAIVCVAAIIATQAGLAADETGQRQLLEMRVRLGRTLKSLPNYVCLQTTERLRASKAKAQAKAKTIDTVKLEVAHVGDKEMYSWPDRNMFADSRLQTALPFGLVATGAYASQVIDILFGTKTQFRWVGKEMLDKRATLRWNFTVPKADSGWTVGNGERSAQVGEEGSTWADAETLDVVRLVVHATQFPARFPLKSVTRNIDYANMRIGAHDVLLPSAVEDLVEEAGGALNINRSQFGHCREYSASSTLTFDESAAIQASEPSRAAAAALPPNLRIQLALDGHLRSDGAVIGAAVNAHVASDVRYRGTVLVPKGTQVRGVLRQFSKTGDGLSSAFSLTVEFTDLALAGGPVPFRAHLKSIDPPMEGLFLAGSERSGHDADGALHRHPLH